MSWPRSFAEAHGSPDKFGRRSGTVVSQFIGRWGGRPSLEGAMACLENAPHLLALCVQSSCPIFCSDSTAENRRRSEDGSLWSGDGGHPAWYSGGRVVDGREAAETEPSSPEEPWFQPGLRFFSPGFLVAGDAWGDECAPGAVAQQRDDNGVAQQTRAVGCGARQATIVLPPPLRSAFVEAGSQVFVFGQAYVLSVSSSLPHHLTPLTRSLNSHTSFPIIATPTEWSLFV